MFRAIGWFDSHAGPGPAWCVLLVQGLVLIGFGVLVAVMPSLLVALVSAVFIVLGSVVTVTALRLRRVRPHYDVVRRGWWIEA